MADRRTPPPPNYPSQIFRRRIRTDSFFRYNAPANHLVNRQQNWILMERELIDGHICLNDLSVSENPWEYQPGNRPPSPPQMEESNHWYNSDEETIILELDGDYSPTPSNDGFLKESISDHIQTRTHHVSGNQEADICVVCQSEYEDKEILGRLQCGHEYHADCITRWLLLRKFCPVCKRTA